MMDAADQIALETINTLMERALDCSYYAGAGNVHEQELMAKRAISYLDAANIIIMAHPGEIYKTCIEREDFMKMRQFAKKFR